MLHISVASNLVLTILVLAASYKTYAAPTHHLTIGVQGKTPTLIVTSSEIGITPSQTLGSNKKLMKSEYIAKSLKDSDVPKKSIKTKLHKNQPLKDKFQHLSKPLIKQTLSEKNSFKLAKFVEHNENENTTLKLTQSTAILLKDQEDPTLKLEDWEITTTNPITSTAPDEAFLHLTTLPPKEITEIPLVSSTNPRVNSTQPEEMSTFTPQATADTVSTLGVISDADSLNIFSAMPTTLNLKDFEDITTTINYNDNTNTVTASGVIQQTQTETKVNDVVVQTQKPTQNLPGKSVNKMENEDDSDRHTDEYIATTENGNLLLTTIEKNAFATPSTLTVTSFPTLVTLITEKEEALTTAESLPLSLTMTTTTTTTANNVDVDNNNNENEQQKPATVHSDKGIHGSIKEIGKIDKRDKEAEVSGKAESQQADVVLNPVKNFMYTTTPTQNMNEEPKSTKNPVENKIKQTTHESVFNETTNEYLQNKIRTTMETIVTTPATLSKEIHEQTSATLRTSHEYQAPTILKTTGKTLEQSNTPTTEKVLNLIDLEKQVLKTIGELKEPSLLMTGQHDSGHDGLKNIKKKQLVDKHYVEALLHNKQDLHVKDLVEKEKYLTQTVQGTEATTTLSSTNSQPNAVTNKTVLMPIKHGYLGPILMEEKTFHVIHHTHNKMTDRNHHVDDIESQLRKGNFVELKVKKDNTADKKIVQTLKNKNMKTSSIEEKEMLEEMQSDQPVDVTNNQNMKASFKNQEQKSSLTFKVSQKTNSNRSTTSDGESFSVNNKFIPDNNHDMVHQDKIENSLNAKAIESFNRTHPDISKAATEDLLKSSLQVASSTNLQPSSSEMSHKTEPQNKSTTVLSTTAFQTIDAVATKTPIFQADTLFNADNKEKYSTKAVGKQQTESKISDIQIEVYDSTVDSIVASTNFKDIESKQQSLQASNDESYLGKTTKPPIAAIQQERFTQYVIDRTETSTHEPINYNTIRVASGKPEPAAIEIHINVSESFGNESEDIEFSYPQTGDSSNNNNNQKIAEESYDDNKVGENIKLKIPNGNGKELENDEILVVEIIDTNNDTNTSFKEKLKNTDDLFITDVKNIYTTPPPPPPPPPYQTNFDRDSDTIFYISNTEVKVGESLPATNKNENEERKLRLESQFFPANYMASTHPSLNKAEDLHPTHHLYEEDIILSPGSNQANSLKIYRNNNEAAPPLDVTYVGESIIEVEQSPESVITTTYATDQQHSVATPQADVIIQPAILPEISIGVPVIGELPPQIELKEIDFMPNEAQLHRSGIYDDNDNNNSNNNDIDENTINGSNNNHDVDIVSGNSNNNQRVDESSIQYGGDLIDESADGGFDGVEGSYPFGNPAVVGKSSSYSYSAAFLTKLRKQQQQKQQQQKPNHVADYAHLYVNYGVNNMRKDELSADVKDPGEMLLNINGGSGNINVRSNEQNTTSFKSFLSKVSMSNYTMPFINANSTHSERMSNATAFSVMEDVNDLEDKNTEDIVNLISLAIGLFIVILPVVVTCSMFWALRYLYKKYHSNLMDNGEYTDQTGTKCPLNENGVEKGEFPHKPSSSPTNSYNDTIDKYQDTSNKPSTTDSYVKFSSEKSNPQLEALPSNTNTTIAYSSSAIVSKKNETLRLSLILSSPMAQKHANKPTPSTSSPLLVLTASEYRNTIRGDVDSEDEDDDDDDVEISGPNGSITKMTLENNLLIVETEERNDISRVARETKMDYNKKGVFVVEVARGIDSKNIPESPVLEGNDKMLSMFDTTQNNGGLGYKITNEKNCANNEKVQIHSPPSENQEEGPRSLHQIEEVEEPINSPHLNENNDIINDPVYKVNTGLSQSDLSSTSSNDSNKGYCYGKQALYVVEQRDSATIKPNGNVVLKCDIKDIKDDDHNPGNDQYLKHLPNKKEELSQNKEDIVDTSQEGESRTNSGESPEQKQNDKLQENIENVIVSENSVHAEEMKEQKEIVTEHLINCNNEINYNLPITSDSPTEMCKQKQNFFIPVEIEVHITPAEDDNTTEDTSLSPSKITLPEDFPVIDETPNVTQPFISESIHEPLEDSLADETPFEISSIQGEQELRQNNTTKEIDVAVAQEEIVDNEASQDAVNSIIMLPLKEEHCEVLTKTVEKLERIAEKALLETAETNENQLKDEKDEPLNVVETKGNLDDKEKESENHKGDITNKNALEPNKKPNLDVNGSTKIEDTQTVKQRNALNLKEELLKTEYRNATIKSELLTNGSAILIEQSKTQQLANGHSEVEYNGNSTNEIENGYDSILSLPEPPPTTDEQLNNDLSDQQLDSLPPPPPPEIFNLKVLPPSLSNGNTDSPQSEETTNFYNTLPPPPPTTLEVTVSEETATATNGKVHASPLTPPASPPAHFTNNLHAGLCSHPIAVDVNGS